MRRNSDEYVRSLERRVKSTLDPAAVVELARLYERLGLHAGETDLSLARGALRDAYWSDVGEIAAIVAEHGEDAVAALDRSISTRRHFRPYPPTQILPRQGGWIDLPGWLADAIEQTGRLARSGPIRDVLEFSYRGKPRDMADISAGAERAFLEDVVSEAVRILRGPLPYPLGTRLRAIRVLSATSGGESHDFEAPIGSTMTLVSLAPYEYEGRVSFSCFFRTDDYWADWGDTIDYEYNSVQEFDEDFEVIS